MTVSFFMVLPFVKTILDCFDKWAGFMFRFVAHG